MKMSLVYQRVFVALAPLVDRNFIKISVVSFLQISIVVGIVQDLKVRGSRTTCIGIMDESPAKSTGSLALYEDIERWLLLVLGSAEYSKKRFIGARNALRIQEGELIFGTAGSEWRRLVQKLLDYINHQPRSRPASSFFFRSFDLFQLIGLVPTHRWCSTEYCPPPPIITLQESKYFAKYNRIQKTKIKDSKFHFQYIASFSDFHLKFLVWISPKN